MKTILITGISGFIGQDLGKQLRSNYNIIGIDLNTTTLECCNIFYKVDITDYDKINELIKKHKPCVIIHTAAMKDLKMCETDKEIAYKVNTEASINLNNISKYINAKFIFVSSDQVFYGNKSLSATSAKKNPLNYYGITKSMAEDEIINNASAAICRTALVFGKIPQNKVLSFMEIRNNPKLVIQSYIVDHVYYKLTNNEEINLPANEYCSPTSVDLLVLQIKTIIEQDLNGIFHCCGGERISRFELGKKIATKFGLNKSLIIPISSKDLLRPKDVSLDITSSQKALGFKFFNIDNMLNKIEVYNDS